MYTPNEWIVTYQHDGLFSVYGHADNAAQTPLLVAKDLSKANANLIATAPKLLKAVELHLAFLDSLPLGWLGNTTGDIGLLNEAYLTSRPAIAEATE